MWGVGVATYRTAYDAEYNGTVKRVIAKYETQLHQLKEKQNTLDGVVNDLFNLPEKSDLSAQERNKLVVDYLRLPIKRMLIEDKNLAYDHIVGEENSRIRIRAFVVDGILVNTPFIMIIKIDPEDNGIVAAYKYHISGRSYKLFKEDLKIAIPYRYIEFSGPNVVKGETSSERHIGQRVLEQFRSLYF